MHIAIKMNKLNQNVSTQITKSQKRKVICLTRYLQWQNLNKFKIKLFIKHFKYTKVQNKQ